MDAWKAKCKTCLKVAEEHFGRRHPSRGANVCVLREDQAAIADECVKILGVGALGMLAGTLVKLPCLVWTSPRVFQSIIEFCLRQGLVERPPCV